MIKITFDYDGCLSQPKIQELAKKCISLGCQVYILTSRFDCIRRLKFKDLKPNDDIYITAEEVGIKPSRIAFTNQEKKWIHLLDTGVHIHIDDDAQVIKELDYYKNLKCFNCNDNNFEEKLFDYIEAIQEFHNICNKV